MNYTFTNKNKRNKDKLLCKNFSKYYFDFLHNKYFEFTCYFNNFTYAIHFLHFLYREYD